MLTFVNIGNDLNSTSPYRQKKGLCFRPQEFDIFLKHWEEIIKAMPELEKFVACYDQSDHFNQLGMLSCQACNPDGWENW